MVDILSLTVVFATYYGIYAILAISLNLEYGYAGQPNFGQVLFYGMGAFVSAIVAANLIPYFHNVPIGNICNANAYTVRYSIGSTDATIAISVWIIALVIAMIVGGIFGILISYPAIRVKEEWYLSMILLVAGEAFVIVVQNTQQIGCGFNGVDGIQNPFYWITQSYSSSFASSNLGVALPGLMYSAVIIACALICYFIAQRLSNSPFGRLLKSIRDDKVASESLGKDVAKVRRQIMLIGSVMAGLAGGLYVYYVGVATADDYVPAITFAVWVMMILGGYANNKGVLLGALVMTLLSRGMVLLSIYLQPYLPVTFNTSIFLYLQYSGIAIILILLLIFRPKGLIPEARIKTKAYELFDFGKKGSPNSSTANAASVAATEEVDSDAPDKGKISR